MVANVNAAVDAVEERFQESLFQTILPLVEQQQQQQQQHYYYRMNNSSSQPSTLSSSSLLLLVGVSGGCDSVALFYLIQRALEQQRAMKDHHYHHHHHYSNITLHVVHFDHQQRGAESDADRRLVEEMCQRYNVPLSVYFWKDYTQRQTAFSQETARDWRRSTMTRLLHELVLAQQNETTTPVGGVILTAHHLDDSNESLLLKLLRGVHITHLSGMESMQVVSLNKEEEENGTPAAAADTTTTIWARPLLSLRKRDLVTFLQHHDLPWREDASNQSNKYLRNRVRNELLPLMQELVASAALVETDSDHDHIDPSILQRRLDYLSEQSREVRMHLEERARDYLKAQPSDKQFFLLPVAAHENDPETTGQMPTLDLVGKQALHMWILNASEGTLHLTYDQLKRICYQLDHYPENRQWRLNVGDDWDVERVGDALRLVSRTETAGKNEEAAVDLRWKLLYCGDESRDGKDRLCIKVPRDKSLDHLRLIMTTNALLPDYTATLPNNHDALRFTPPWRRGHRPVKVTEFLRGQKVPLHLREHARVILLQNDVVTPSSETNPSRHTFDVVAAYVPLKEEWVVDERFEKHKNDGGQELLVFLDT